MSEYYGKYDKKETVQLFVDNLIWGNITINDFVYRMDDFRRSLEQYIINFQKNPTGQTVEWIYEAIIRLRVNGALSYELRDKSAEEIINGLREFIRQKDSQIDTLHTANLRLAAELNKITTIEPPMKRDVPALG